MELELFLYSLLTIPHFSAMNEYTDTTMILNGLWNFPFRLHKHMFIFAQVIPSARTEQKLENSVATKFIVSGMLLGLSLNWELRIHISFVRFI